MKKILLTLVTAFVAFGAFADEYPVVKSVEELASYPDSTMVLFENIEVTVVEQDFGYYVQQTPCLSDGTTQIGGSVYPVPSCFTAVGFVHTAESWDGSTYREFYVETVQNVSKFATLGELLRFASLTDNVEVLNNSTNVVAESGTAIISSVYEDYAFFYTLANTGYSTQPVYGVLKYADADENLVIGDEVTAYGGLKGTVVPTVATYDEEYNLVSYKGGHYAMDTDVYLYAINWDAAVPIQYNACSFGDFENGYVAEAQPVRISKGGTLVEKEGKYYYEATAEVEEYVEGEGWVWVKKTYSTQVASAYVDLAEYAGKVIDEYLAGVWDWCNTGDEARFLLNKFVSSVAEYDNIKEFLAMGEQYEEEIITSFVNPLLVTYVYSDGYKCIIMVQDESGSLALNYGELMGTETAEEAAVKAIKPGDMITGVKGYPQFYVSNVSPVVYGAIYNWTTDETVSFIPEVVSSGNAVKPTMTVTVGDMLNEWRDCQENSTMPTIANNVVSVLDAQVLDTLDQWGSPIKYLIQGTDTMELSNLWFENNFNFTTYERNNIVGIADYYRINGNGIYQLQPLSQEHITDASLIPEVTTVDELKAHEGTPVIYLGAEVSAVIAGWDINYYLGDGETLVYGMPLSGKFDLAGVYVNGVFEVSNIVAIHGFNSISDIDNYVANVNPDAAGQAFEVLKPIAVSHVEGDNVFVYYSGINSWGGTQVFGSVLQGVKTTVKKGDFITGVKGVSYPCDSYTDEEWNTIVERGAYFAVAEDADVTVVSSDNEINYSAATGVMSLVSQSYSYGATPVKLQAGTAIVERDGKYYGQEEAEKWGPVDPDNPDGEWEAYPVTYEIELVSTAVDLSAYAGTTTEAIFSGVLDYKNSSADVAVYYVHSAQSVYLEYENIAELIAAGGNNFDFVSALNSTVVVSYIHDSGWDKVMFVQDETAGLYVTFSEPDVALEGVKVGDAIKGLKGKAQWDTTWNGGAARLDAYDNEWVDYPLDIVSSDNEVLPLEVTIAQLRAEEAEAVANLSTAAQYASRLVKISGVTLTSGIDAYDEEWPCLVQGTDTLWVPKNFAETWSVESDKTYNIVGIVDFKTLNYSNLYTIQPRSTDDINDVTGVEGVEDVNGGIYLNAANQVVANGAVEIAVYDLNGRVVATANADVLDANGLAQGVYVARAKYADGAAKTAKVVR